MNTQGNNLSSLGYCWTRWKRAQVPLCYFSDLAPFLQLFKVARLVCSFWTTVNPFQNKPPFLSYTTTTTHPLSQPPQAIQSPRGTTWRTSLTLLLHLTFKRSLLSHKSEESSRAAFLNLEICDTCFQFFYIGYILYININIFLYYVVPLSKKYLLNIIYVCASRFIGHVESCSFGRLGGWQSTLYLDNTLYKFGFLFPVLITNKYFHLALTGLK